MKNIIITMILLTSCACAKPEEKKIIGSIIQTSPEKPIVIGTLEGVSSNNWTATEEMVEKIQPVVVEYLKSNWKERVYDHLEDYRCQYIGIVINGNHQIYCSFFKSEGYPDWKKFDYPILMDAVDVGWSYFHFVYDINEGKCKGLIHRGP